MKKKTRKREALSRFWIKWHRHWKCVVTSTERMTQEDALHYAAFYGANVTRLGQDRAARLFDRARREVLT